MALEFTEIENLLVRNQSESSLVKLIVAYVTLKQKLEDTESHSFYFNQAIASKLERLASLHKDYENIRALFNESTIDFFIHKINENDIQLSGIDGKGRSLIQRMSYSWRIGENEFHHELIRLKSKIGVLMPIDYYLENSDEFLKIIN